MCCPLLRKSSGSEMDIWRITLSPPSQVWLVLTKLFLYFYRFLQLIAEILFFYVWVNSSIISLLMASTRCRVPSAAKQCLNCQQELTGLVPCSDRLSWESSVQFKTEHNNLRLICCGLLGRKMETAGNLFYKLAFPQFLKTINLKKSQEVTGISRSRQYKCSIYYP